MDERREQKVFEERFLAQLAGRARTLVKANLPVDRVHVEQVADGADQVRQQLSAMGHHDARLLDELPGRRGALLRFSRPTWVGLFRDTVVRLRARVLTDTAALVRGETPGPIDREAVLKALSENDRLPKREQPTCVVFASPTGFTDEAKQLVEASRAPALVLLGGRADGGWDVVVPRAIQQTTWARLFDLEGQSHRLQRISQYLSNRAGELETSGVAVPQIARELSIPFGDTEHLVRQACRQDPRLMTVAAGDTIRVCRSPLANEGTSMGMWSRIKRLFGAKPSPAERVRELTAQRVLLEQQRGELDRQVDTLESDERQLLQQGAQAPSQAEKKQVANKLIRVRKELRRYRTRVQMFNQQIDVLGTQIHHMTLQQQSAQVPMPTPEELTQQAAEAEQMMNALASNAELATNIEATGAGPQTQAEEDAVLAEFDQYAQQTPTEAAPDGGEPVKQIEPEPETEGRAAEQPPRESTRPELG